MLDFNIIVQFVSQAPWSLAILTTLILAYTRLRDEIRSEMSRLREDVDRRIEPLDRQLIGLRKSSCLKALFPGRSLTRKIPL